jgi:hypothetical protein
MTDQYQDVVETAQKTLKEKGADKLRFVIEGGKALKVRVGMKAQLIAFFTKLQDKKKAEAKPDQ